jgi:hypothetical protein
MNSGQWSVDSGQFPDSGIIAEFCDDHHIITALHTA